MDIQAIFNAGGTVIKNPNYRKGKKNTEPEYITVSDLDSGIKPDGSLVADIAYDAAARGDQSILGRNGELDKYIERGLTPNGWENLDSQLAEQQGVFSKFGNALAQTVVSELTLGTAKGISDLFDLIGQGIGVSDGDYSNPVSRFLEEKQEEFRNFAPIYSDPNLNISNGGLLDPGWWASNMPSIISSLTLLIPSSGVVKGVSYLGKLGNVSSRTRNAVRVISGVNSKMKEAEALRKAGKTAEEIAELTKLNGVQRFLTSASTAKQTSLFLENATTAALSRAMENYQEARQTYNDMYAEASEYLKDDDHYKDFIEKNKDNLKKAGVDITDKDSVAKYVSSSAADRTFQLDWYNVGWDVLEMYGLRNAWKGLKNANGTPSAVRRAEKAAIKYFGKRPEEIAKLKAQRSFMEKAGEWTSDKLYGSKLIIGSELSEGAEEALNYIATEEGMRFGRVLLGSEKGKNKGVWENIRNGFDGRLGSYLQAPELYDAAFWGVLGGVVFQVGGSALRRLGQKFEKSDADEKAKKSTPWYQLDELPENQRRISEIEARATDFATYKAQLDKINSGIDIYNSTEDNEVKFNSNAEADVAREKLKDEFIASMTLRAMNSGNYDMLKAFLKNDNVRKNLIESGVFGKAEENGKSASDIEAESKEYIDSAVRRMDEIANMYEEELTAIDYASSRIGNDVLAEYMQIMANNNVHTQLALRQNNLSLAGTNARIGQLETQPKIKSKLDPNINHANNIKVGLISSELGKLYAEKQNITKQEDSISKNISLENINKKIKLLEDELSNEELIFATSLALRYTKGEDGKYTTSDTPDYFEYRDKQIINRTEDMSGKMFESLTSLDLSDRARTVLNDEELQKYKVLKQDADSDFATLKQISPELNDLYAVRAATELSSKMLNSEIIRTVDEVKSYANMLHNTMSEARVTAINQASKTILNLYKKYGYNVENYISRRYRNESGNIDALSENERRDLDDALKVLALSKSYNKNLGVQLEMMFRQYDAVEASRDSADDNEKGEENTTNSEANTDTINQDVNNTTETTIQADTEQEVQQSDENQPTIDPQETENRTPAYYAKFQVIKGVLTSTRHSNTDNGGAAVYDNNDGTFTLDVRDDKQALNDNRFFSNADEVDLMRPYEVVEKPILKKDKKGKLVMSKKGTLVNTDTLEYQAAQQQEQQISQQNEEPSTEQTIEQGNNDVTEQNTNTTTPPVEGNADNLSTGGVTEETPQTTTVAQQEQKSSTETTTSVYDDVVPDETTAEDEIRMSSLGRFQKEFKANNDVDLDAIAKEIINAEVKKGQDRQVVEGAVNKSLAIIKRVIERKKGKASKTTMKSTVDDVVMQSSILELTNKNPFVEDYTNAVKNMIDEFCKELGINEYNGKKYINLEDLLRYVNMVSNDSQISNMIFDGLKVYLNTDEAKTKFITTDENQNSDTLKKNIAKSAAQRYQERISDTTTQRVNIWDLRSSLSSQKEIEEFEEAIEALNKGDKLSYTREDNKIVLKDTKGRTIGTLSIPRVNSKTGAYEMTNDGWKYDILTQSGGTINSKLKALFSHWLNEENDACKELNAIIYELAFEKPSSERKQELLDKFNENEEIKAAKAQGYIDNKVGNKKLINGLVKLWRYQSYTNGTVNISKNRRIAMSLDSWFSKLRNSYNGVRYLINNTDGEIEVANISDGEIIRVSETDGQKAALPANKAIAGGVNPDVHKLAISSRTPNTLTVSGMPSINFSGVGKMNTFVLLPNRNGSYEYIQAYPADITDDYIGKDAKELIKTIQNKVLELLDNHSKNPTQESFNEVKDFVKSVLSNRNGNSSLFWNLTLFEQSNTFGINFGKTIKIVINAKNGNVDVSKPEYPLNNKGYKQKQMKLGTKDANKAVTELLNNLRFNLNPTYITSDNATNTILNGIAKRRNGKFEITIGDKTWSYDSYNAFVLNNNLVRLNTKPNERGTSNFNPRGSRTQSANQVLEIRINNAISSPVEDTTEEQQHVEPVAPNIENVSIPEKALAILNGTQQSKHVGNDIAALVFNDKQLKSLKDLELLPEKLIFDENFNKQEGYETINAAYNNKTKDITVGSRWFNMFSNPTTRNQAIRKLIHEQLHYKLNRSKEYVRSVQSIYDEFKEYLDKNNVPKDAHIRAYLFENESTQLKALEEFLVESLTSEELARYLNGIKTSVPTKRGAKNLWQRILIALSDIFGWKVTKGSLYEKELNTIRELKLSSEDVEQNTETQTDNSESNVEQEDNDTDNNLQENSDNNLQENNKTDEEKIEVQDEETEETDESSDDFVDFSDDLIDEFESSITEQPVSQTETAYTKEEQNILSRAPRNANGQLLAPNGRPTNLTERQWLQVRTKAFKDWFGDWEKGTIFTANNVDDIEELKRKYPSTLPNKFYHHSTNKFGRQPFDSREGTKEKLHIVGRLITDKVDALVVENPNSDNKISHITLATATGVKPFESNKELQLHQDKIQPLDDYVDTTFRNNMSNDVSKVVDENGEPLVVYHGSNEYGFSVFDPSKSDDKISLFASSSKWIASTYTSFKPLENALIRKELLKGNAIDLIKNRDWESLEKLINSVVDNTLPRPEKGGFSLPYGNKTVLDKILTIQKELDNPNLTEEERLSLLADLTKAEDEYYYSRNYTFRVKQRTSIHGRNSVEISIDDSYIKEFSSYYTEEGIIFRGSPEELIESLTFDTKVYDLFLNIKNPLIIDNQFNEYGHANNWNNLDFSPAAKDVQNKTLWGEVIAGTHKETKTRDVAAYAKKNNYDGVIFKKIADVGGYPGYQSLNPMTDSDYLYEDMHIGEDSFNATNKRESDILIAFNSNQIKSAADNIGAFSNEDDDIYHSSVTEERITLMPNVPSIASISDMLPLEQQPEFDALVASAEFETSCR